MKPLARKLTLNPEVIVNIVTRLEEGKGCLVLHRKEAKPFVIGYDWVDASPGQLHAAVKERWRGSKR